jgi:hypothetical protein
MKGSFSYTAALVVAAVLHGACFGQDDKKAKVTRVKNVAVIHHGSSEGKVLDKDGQPLPVVKASNGVKVVRLLSGTANFSVDDEEFETASVPQPEPGRMISGTAVTSTTSGFTVRNNGDRPVVAIVEEPASSTNPNPTPHVAIIPPGESAQIPKGNGTCVMVNPLTHAIASHYHVAPSQPPASQEREAPKIPDQPTPPQRADSLQQGLFVNTGPLTLRGVMPETSGLFINEAELHVDRWVRFIPGFVIVDRLDTKDFSSWGAGIVVDLQVIQLRFGAGMCEFEAEGRQIHMTDPGGMVTDVFPETFEGDMWWIQVGIFWPALMYRSGPFEVAAGPDFTWFYMEEQTDTRSNGAMSFDFHRRYYENVYTVGGRVTVAYFGFTLQAAGGVLLGDLTGGTSFEVLLGKRFDF